MRKTTMARDYKEIVNHPFFSEWFKITRPILVSREFQKRKIMKHHDESVFSHCVRVSFEAFKMAKKKSNDIDVEVCAIAGLLHDFYPEAWQYTEDLEKLDESYRIRFLPGYKWSISSLHGFVHGHSAMENACKFYPELMNDKIMNSIHRHMFPLTPIPPKYKEGWIITLADKKVSFAHLPKVTEWYKYVTPVVKK